MVEIAQNLTVEPEKDEEVAFSTFLRPAPEMPTFSEDELDEGLDEDWRKRAKKLFQIAASRSSRP